MPHSFDNSKPIYVQVREILEDMILKEQIKEGEQAPSSTQLAKFYKINHITVGKGVNQLVDEDILYKKRGVGMFVAEGAKEKLISHHKQQFIKEYVQPLLAEAEKLELTDKEIVRLIKQEKGSESFE